jgi:hypothetical protein
MARSWNPSCLFVATLDGFYFDEIDKIIAADGAITMLDPAYIPISMQAKYLKILQDFETSD